MSSGGNMLPAMARSSGGSMSPAMTSSASARRGEHRNGGGRFWAEIEMDRGVALPRSPELGFAAAVREPLVRLQRPKFDFERWDWGYFAWPHDRLDDKHIHARHLPPANLEMRDSNPRATFEADRKVTESFLSRSTLQVKASQSTLQSSPQLEARPREGGFPCRSSPQLEAGQCFVCQSTLELVSGFPSQSTVELEAGEGFLSQSSPQLEASDGFPSGSTLQLEAGEDSPDGRSMLQIEIDDDMPLGRGAAWRRGCAESNPFLLDHCKALLGHCAY